MRMLSSGPAGERVRDLLVPWGMQIEFTGPVLGTDEARPEPRLPAGSCVVVGGRAFQERGIRLEPLRTFPSGILDKTGAQLLVSLVIWQCPKTPRVGHLLERVDDVVDLAVLLGATAPNV